MLNASLPQTLAKYVMIWGQYMIFVKTLAGSKKYLFRLLLLFAPSHVTLFDPSHYSHGTPPLLFMTAERRETEFDAIFRINQCTLSLNMECPFNRSSVLSQQ